MKIYLVAHYALDRQESMLRYGAWLADGFRNRGWEVETLRPSPRLGRLAAPGTSLGKWLGYLDKYLLFAPTLTRAVQRARRDKQPYAFCITDHSHGMYLPLLEGEPHVLHCHDLIAIRAMLGEFPRARLGRFGRVYQWMILRGLRRARRVVCVSEATAQDWRRIVGTDASLTIAYNGLNHSYGPLPQETLITALSEVGLRPQQYFLHVGSDAWNKNRDGVVELFIAHRQRTPRDTTSLVFVGPEPSQRQQDRLSQARLTDAVTTLSQVSAERLNTLYAGASCLLFPSLMEGFGWPIVEANACGTPVLTTELAPMTEVGGEAAYYLPALTDDSEHARGSWAQVGANALADLLERQRLAPEEVAETCLKNAGRFQAENSLNRICETYPSNPQSVACPAKTHAMALTQ
ncbi:MAG: glycosyltransferase family 4 protein [Opitutales bacterium]